MIADRVVALVLAGAGVAGAWTARERLEAGGASRAAARELLYLPSGDYLRVASLGHGPLLADLVYIWSILFYSDYEREDRYRYVQHIFGEVIPKLDPHYADPYWLGALILIVERNDLEGGLRLLDQGFENSPRSWILPYMAGWECHWSGRYARAARYFEKAASVPGAPPHLRRVRAGMIARAGDLEAAIRLWREILDDPDSDEGARDIASRQIAQLRARFDLGRIREAIGRYRDRHGRPPSDLDALVRAGLLEAVPEGPEDGPYAYDPATGAVRLPGAGRVLGSP